MPEELTTKAEVGESLCEALVCTKETFRPFRMNCIKWWRKSDYEEYFRATEPLWGEAHNSEDWAQAYDDGWTYCSAIVDGQSVATAANWPRTDTQWEVAAVGTAPAFRREGYGKAVVSFVTEHILQSGRIATISFVPANMAMRKTAESVGFCPVPLAVPAKEDYYGRVDSDVAGTVVRAGWLPNYVLFK